MSNVMTQKSGAAGPEFSRVRARRPSVCRKPRPFYLVRNHVTSATMVALLFFLLRLLVSPFRPVSRLEAEMIAALTCRQTLRAKRFARPSKSSSALDEGIGFEPLQDDQTLSYVVRD